MGTLKVWDSSGGYIKSWTLQYNSQLVVCVDLSRLLSIVIRAFHHVSVANMLRWGDVNVPVFNG